jgi:uncharacterized protein (DUF488 family)
MLFTIGTSNRTSAEFFWELDRRGIWLLVDVRSRPYSRNPWANGSALQVEATRHGIEYAWSGGVLGGLNSISTDDRGFQISAEALVDATDRGSVAIFCAEGDPSQCHRSYKIAAYLRVRQTFCAINILRNGSHESIEATLRRTKLSDVPACLRYAVQLISGPDLLFSPEALLCGHRAS